MNLSTSDPKERQLLNVVEEMAIASGVPVPSIYVLDSEKGINTFSAGHDIGDAAIGVTRGCLHVLNRDELQAMVAHEFSHVLNGDIRLNVRLIGVLFGIMMIGSTGRWIFEKGIFVGAASRGRRGSINGVPIMIAGGGLIWLVGSFGLFTGRLIQRAITRQRAYLADASAVQFTRNPDGLVGALKKIGGYASGAKVFARETAEMSHIFFGDAVSSDHSMFSTHPTLVERIRRLEPSFAGVFETVHAPNSLHTREAVVEPSHITAVMPMAAGMSMAVAPLLTQVMSIDPKKFVADLGTISPEHLAFSQNLLATIPEDLREAARSTLGGVALVYALMMEGDCTTEAEFAALKELTHERIFAETERLLPLTRALDPLARLPLIELTIGSLRGLSPDQYATFRRELGAIAAADNRLSIFEFAVQKSVVHWLDSAFGLRTVRPVQYYAPRALKTEISTVLSALAYASAREERDAAMAFQLGASQMRLMEPGELVQLTSEEFGFDKLDGVLDRLDAASPAVKKQVLTACAHVVLCDGQIDPAESELLRVVADAMGCPAPPMIPTAAMAA
ncbi:MAG: Zn-dependent protease with chaperone function [Bradymonadia bacterium]